MLNQINYNKEKPPILYNGIMDVNIDSFEPQTTSDYLKYLMDVTCSKIKKILILILQVIYKH